MYPVEGLLIRDWCTARLTILHVIVRTTDPGPGWSTGQSGRFRVVASQSALEASAHS